MFNRFLVLPFLMIALTAGCASIAQTPSSKLAEPLTYVYEFPGEGKADLFRKSKLWVAETYNSAEAVITFDDVESGTIKGTEVGSGVWSFYERKFKYNLGIDVRDGKTRLQFSNFQPLQVGGVAGIDPSYQEAYEIIKQNLDQTAKSYKEYMSDVQDDDW